MEKKFHTSVLLKESVEGLNIKPNGFYIDATLGEAGHSLEILKKLNKDGLLVSIDQDDEAIAFVKKQYSKELSVGNWILKKGNFSNISRAIEGINRKPDGILMDIGMSSRQIDIAGRGFSYMNDEDPLDMRMDSSLNVTAADLLKVLNDKQLTKLFFEYGEERFSGRIAREIKKKEVNTVGDLKSLIYKVVPATSRRGDYHHPARRVFQALRIAVNDELNALKQGLDEGFRILNANGRLVVITFHSLEDRIVKNFFKDISSQVTTIEEGVGPSEEEINLNSRSHSARLRIIEKNDKQN